MEKKQTEERAAMEERVRRQYLIIGRKIAYYRRLKGYTQEEFAAKIGISPNYLSQIECGKKGKYPIYLLIHTAGVLDVELKALCE